MMYVLIHKILSNPSVSRKKEEEKFPTYLSWGIHTGIHHLWESNLKSWSYQPQLCKNQKVAEELKETAGDNSMVGEIDSY